MGKYSKKKTADEGVSLRELRVKFGKSQNDLASVMGHQAEVSRFETRGDHRLSNIRKYVRALNGELEIFARFDNETIKLSGH